MKQLLALLLLVPSLCLAQLPNYVATDGLVAWYTLDGHINNEAPSSGWISDDYNGISFNGNYISNRNGAPNSAAGLPANHLLQLPLNPAILSNEFTLSFWVYKRANIGHDAVQIMEPNGPGRANFGFTTPR